MRIVYVVCDERAEDHIRSRHGLRLHEVEEAAYGNRRIQRGREPGLYEVYGRSEAGRYLMVVVRYLGGGRARLITARDMSPTQRRRYLKYIAH